VAHVHVVHHRSYSDTGDDDDGRETTVEEAGPVRYQVCKQINLLFVMNRLCILQDGESR
jgi:fatty acid desaturase